MNTKELNCKVILKSTEPITLEQILKLEQVLNSSTAIQIWTNMAVGTRFHLSIEEEVCQSTETAQSSN